MKNNLTFKNSKLWPDNSHIRWEMNGKGFIGNKVMFQLHSNNDFDWTQDSTSVSVLEPGTNYAIKESPIFWNTIEQDRGVNTQLPDQWKHNDRRAAMQWAEDYLMKMLQKQICTI